MRRSDVTGKRERELLCACRLDRPVCCFEGNDSVLEEQGRTESGKAGEAAAGCAEQVWEEGEGKATLIYRCGLFDQEPFECDLKVT